MQDFCLKAKLCKSQKCLHGGEMIVGKKVMVIEAMPASFEICIQPFTAPFVLLNVKVHVK